MNDWMAIISMLGFLIIIPAARAVTKAIRAHKSTADIVADALDAAVDSVEKKKK